MHKSDYNEEKEEGALHAVPLHLLHRSKSEISLSLSLVVFLVIIFFISRFFSAMSLSRIDALFIMSDPNTFKNAFVLIFQSVFGTSNS